MSYNPRSFRKFLATSVSAAVVATIAAPIAPVNVSSADAASASFSDVQSNAFYYEAVQYLVGQGVLKGYSDGTYKPQANVKRSEAAQMLAEVLELDTSNTSKSNFTDVKAGEWYTGAINALVDAKIINGYKDGTFKPNETITRAELAQMLVTAYNLDLSGSNNRFSDVKAGAWYSAAVATLVDYEITTGKTSTTFAPGENVTRGQAATFVYRSELLGGSQLPAPTEKLKVLEAVTNTTVTINGVTYNIADNLKGLLNENNKEALKGAKILFGTSDNTINKITYLVLTNSGKDSTDANYSGNVVLDCGNTKIDGHVKVSADYVTLKNVTITGDFEVGGQAENVFYADNVTVQGKTFITEAKVKAAAVSILNTKKNTVIFNNSSLNSVDVNKTGVNVEARGNTSVKDVSVSRNANITAAEGVTLPKVTIRDGVKEVELSGKVTDLAVQSKGDITLSGKVDIERVNVESNASMKLNTDGKVGEITAKNPDAKLNVGDKASLEKVVLADGKKESDFISNYDSVKDRVGNVTPPAGGGGGSSTPTVDQVTSLTGSAGNGEVALTWTAVSGAVGYEVYYYQGTSAPSNASGWISGMSTSDPITGTSYTVTGLTNDLPYLFKVLAYKGSQSSPIRGEAGISTSVTPSAQSAVTVTTKEELIAKLADSNVPIIKLGADIEVDGYLNVTRDVTIHGNNHKITRSV
ncbi:S-layer homology domain-containing protein, partial [Anaerobacillus sp. MEB173]|uniref:S-layer homology domain-containing protein n=1 Tax=Anaerobacillus sp. MEB173 TaxID=3383345 RepID=UPI003F8DDAC7